METNTEEMAAGAERSAPPRAYEGWNALPIGGQWRAGRAGKHQADHDPFTGEVLVEIPLANAEDVDEAYRAAERAQPAWGASLPQDRQRVLARAAELMVRRKDEITRWIIKESGGTRTKALLEWQLAYYGLLEAASYPSHVEGSILPAGVPGKESRVYRRPVGVVGVISPWNFPLQLSNRSVAPALAVGNAVVLKPASDTPVTGGLMLAKLFEEAGLPAGVLSVVVGAGSDVGDAFVDHPVPRVISFTGSTPVGRRIGERAGRAVKRVCLELGGNSPFVVLADADVEQAAQAAINGKFMHQGQICMAINRIIVDARVHDAFLEAFATRAAALKVGDPNEPDTAIGPLINQAQCDRLRDIVGRTVAEGARVLLGGEGARGLVFPPTILTGVTNQMSAAREELFGPVAPILRVEGDDEAIAVANDTEYGLSSAIFTRDLERGVRLALRIEAGMTHVNDIPVNDEPNTAFGGEKASGIGRFGGRWAVEEFTTDHWISVQHAPRSYPL
jgi:aldehyde dehydrogenase (NAD+)